MFHASGPLFVGMSLVVCAPLLPAAPLPRPSPEKVRKELDVLWADLLSPDELTAGRALLKCATRPQDTVNYLKDKLSPLNLSKKRAKRLKVLEDLATGHPEAAPTKAAKVVVERLRKK
jgi:hypothetical protein